MWQTAELDQLLYGVTTGIRPVLRSMPQSDPDDVAMINRRHRHRRQADGSSDRPEVPTQAGAAACLMLELLDTAIVLLRPDRSVVFANPAAKRLAARGNCIRFRAQRLQLIDHHEQCELETFLRHRIARRGTDYRPRRVHGGGDRCDGYVLHAAWLDDAPTGLRTIASVRIYEPHRQVGLSAEFLASLYGLTRMESRLAAALFDSPALQEAAEHCAIGLNTAKTHLKQVFVKCGVQSKAELLRVLALGPRPT